MNISGRKSWPIKQATTIAIIIALVFLNIRVQAASKASLIPLSKGDVWIYRGHLDTTESGSQKVISKNVELREEIIEVQKLGNIVAAVVKGHPDDLASFDENPAPGRYLLVLVENKKLYLLGNDRVDQILHKIRSGKDPKPELSNEELVAQAPFVGGAHFGGDLSYLPGEKRPPSNMYVWWVEKNSKADLHAVKLSHYWSQRLQHATCAELIYRSNPSTILTNFVPGLGFLSYAYEHHGTVLKYDLKLVQFCSNSDK